jgi:hypothetical protein
MNTVVHHLNETETNLSQLKDSFRSILHSILFCRCLGPIEPQVRHTESFPDVAYMYVRSHQETIENVLNQLANKVINHEFRYVSPDIVQGQVCVSFYQTGVKSTFFGSLTMEKYTYERWVIPFLVSVGDQRKITPMAQRRQKELARMTLMNNLFEIVKCVNDYSKHLPPHDINSPRPLPFLFDIGFECLNEKSKKKENWFSKLLKRDPYEISGFK